MDSNELRYSHWCLSERQNASIIELEKVTSTWASTRSRQALNNVASTSPLTFSIPESAYSTGRPAETRCLLAASSSWHVHIGSSRAATVHAKIFREKLSMAAWKYARVPSSSRMTVVSTCQASLGCVARTPTVGFGG